MAIEDDFNFDAIPAVGGAQPAVGGDDFNFSGIPDVEPVAPVVPPGISVPAATPTPQPVAAPAPQLRTAAPTAYQPFQPEDAGELGLGKPMAPEGPTVIPWLGRKAVEPAAPATPPPEYVGELGLGQPIAPDDAPDGGDSYLTASGKAGGWNLLGGLAKVLDTANPFTLSESDAAVLYKNDPAKLKEMQDSSVTMVLSRFAHSMQGRSEKAMENLTPEDKPLSKLEYLTADQEKAAYRSPTRVIGDAIQSLPTSLAMGITAYLTRGAASKAEAMALANGATASAARAEAIKAGTAMASRMGAGSEGAFGYAQQAEQTHSKLSKLSPEDMAKAPLYQQLMEEGYSPQAARAAVIAKTSEEAGVSAGAVDAIVNKVGGEFLGKILTEGGRFIPRVLKGAATEGITETVQSGGEQLGENAATQKNVNPDQSLTEGVGESMAQGLVVGGVMGGATAGFGGKGNDGVKYDKEAIEDAWAKVEAQHTARRRMNTPQQAAGPTSNADIDGMTLEELRAAEPAAPEDAAPAEPPPPAAPVAPEADPTIDDLDALLAEEETAPPVGENGPDELTPNSSQPPPLTPEQRANVNAGNEAILARLDATINDEQAIGRYDAEGQAHLRQQAESLRKAISDYKAEKIITPADDDITPPPKPGELDQVPWTAKDGNPWGMSDEDYAVWRTLPENAEAVARWNKDNNIIDDEAPPARDRFGNTMADLEDDVSDRDIETFDDEIQGERDFSDAWEGSEPVEPGNDFNFDDIPELPASAQADAKPFDAAAWNKTRDDTIKASREAGNIHLDKIPAAVETMRGKEIYNVHDPKERGVIRTVANTGEVVVYWADQYSADKNLATEKTEKRGNKETKVQESWLAPTDLKDYVAAKPTAPAAPADLGRQAHAAGSERKAPKELKDKLGWYRGYDAAKKEDIGPSRATFEKMASKGVLRQSGDDTIKPTPEALKKAGNPVEYGRLYGYSEDDIAHFYWKRRGGQPAAYDEYARDLKDAGPRPAGNPDIGAVPKAAPVGKSKKARPGSTGPSNPKMVENAEAYKDAAQKARNKGQSALSPENRRILAAQERSRKEAEAQQTPEERAELEEIVRAQQFESGKKEIINDLAVAGITGAHPAHIDAAARLMAQDENLSSEDAYERAVMQDATEDGIIDSTAPELADIPFDDFKQPSASETEPARRAEGAGGARSEAQEEDAGDRAGVRRAGENGEEEKARQVTTEKTEAGEQTVLPGAEKIGDGKLAQRKADEKLKPKVAQKDAGGLFGDDSKQTDLMDFTAKKPEPKAEAAAAPEWFTARTQAGIDALAGSSGLTPTQRANVAKMSWAAMPDDARGRLSAAARHEDRAKEMAEWPQHFKDTAATAPAGVTDGELSKIVEEFNDAQSEMMEGEHPVSNIFQPPAKKDIVRLADKARIYTKENGWMTPAEAKAQIAKWKANAKAQGKTSANSDKVVLSLFDLSGEWSKPWEEAGYQVYRFDIQDDPEVGDVNNFSTEFFGDWFGDFDGMDIHAILAANPCTDFAVSGARHFAAKDKDGRTVASVKLVHQTLRTIEYFKPAVWAIENPVGRIEDLGGLPPWRLSFDPNHIGDPYTKKTLLWGRFNGDLPVAPVEPTEGSKMWSQYGGKSQATKNARSVTPEGFSYGFFMANNAVDHPAMAVANKYDRLDRGLIEKAVAAGVTPEQIDNAVEDFYYQDLDDDAANEAIRDLRPEAKKDAPAAKTEGQDFDPAQHVLIAADSIEQLRPQDVERLFEEAPHTADAFDDLRIYLYENRPDLSTKITDAIDAVGMPARVNENAESPKDKLDRQKRMVEKAKRIMAHVRAGGRIIVATQTKATTIAHPENLKIGKDGLYTKRGKEWDYLLESQLDNILEQIGGPAKPKKSFGLTDAETKSILDTPLETLRARDEYIAPGNTKTPTTDFPQYPLGTAKVGIHNDPNEAYVEVLREFSPDDLTPTEGEDGIRRSEIFQNYKKWAEDGIEPPPIFVAQSANGDGKLLSTNRRRVLAAQDAGVKTIKGWYGPINPDTGNPLKYGDVLKAAGRPAAKPEAKAAPVIEDFGEKIGGARKDTAAKGEAQPRAAKPADDRPTWAKRFTIRQVDVKEDGDPAFGKRWVIDDSRTRKPVMNPSSRWKPIDFATQEEAERMLPLIAVAQKHRVAPRGADDYAIVRDISDRKRVVIKDGFATREDATKYLHDHAIDILETKTGFGEEILATPEAVKRKGVERRKGDATPQDFSDAFGFRGVEFGNWNNQDERQEVMNHAYDGLMDMADLLGVPPRALSLDGDLGIAFGARGHGLSGARAHYERDYGVINLTKMSGAGSLAHEWLHAIDHYLGRVDSKASGEREKNERGDLVYKGVESEGRTYISHGAGQKTQLRKELREAIDNVFDTIRYKAEQYVEDTVKAEKFLADSRDAMRRKLDEIRSGLAKPYEYGKRFNKAATPEQLARFDALAEKLLNGEDLERKFITKPKGNHPSSRRASFSGRWSIDTVEALAQLHKEIRGRAGFSAEGHGPMDNLVALAGNYSKRIALMNDAAGQSVKIRKVPTEFMRESRKIDEGRRSDYWSTPHEMAARAFSAYVEDKLAERGENSDFLSYGSDNAFYRIYNMRPFPEGAERKAVAKAFDDLFKAFKLREGKRGPGTALYSAVNDGDVEALDAIIDAEPFYSAVDRAVAGSKQTKATAAEWLGPRVERKYIQKDKKTGKETEVTEVSYSGIIGNTPGVKPEELEWLGVEPWLREQSGPVTKQALQDFIRANQIEVKEVQKGDVTRDNIRPDEIAQAKYKGQWEERVALQQAIRERNPNDWWNSSEFKFNQTIMDDIHNRMVDETLARAGGEQQPTKFGQWQLPGGENYRELLLTLPTKGDAIERLNAFVRELQEKYKVKNDAYVRANAEEQAKWDTLLAESNAKVSREFNSSHWDESNVLAHTRFSDRVIDGKKTLLIEEIQSDWHQAGRKKGYQEPAATLDDLKNGRRVKDAVLNSEGATLVPAKWDFDVSGQTFQGWGATEAEAKQHALHDVNTQRLGGAGSVPNAPFKTTWSELAMKRLIRYAAENGYEKIAWVDGATQAARYDLSQHIKKIVLRPEQGGQMFHLEARGLDGETVLDKRVRNADDAAEHIGKDPAEKLFSGENKEKLDAGASASLEGLDLKIGGEGMETFYDEILPATVNKLVKKYGARVGTQELEGAGDAVTVYEGPEPTVDQIEAVAKAGNAKPTEKVFVSPITGARQEYQINRVAVSQSLRDVRQKMDADGWPFWRAMALHGNEALAEIFGGKLVKEREKKGTPVHTLDLTPQLKTTATEKGFPLFDAGPSLPILTEVAEAKREQLERVLTRLVRQVAGPSANVRFVATHPVKGGVGYGKLGETFTSAAGSYLQAERLITVALADPKFTNPISTAFHEAFHAVEDLLLTDSELKILKDNMAGLRELVAARWKHLTREQIDQFADYEIRAMAFQAYAYNRVQKVPMKGVSGAVRRVMEKLRNVLDGVRRVLNGEGFKTPSDVFSDVYEGKAAKRRPKARGFGTEVTGPLRSLNSDAFAKWFGDSKVVDKSGKPRVVYHATSAKEFKTFRMPAYFAADAKVADSFGADDDGARIVPAYLSIQNPKYIKDYWEFAELQPDDIARYAKQGYDGFILEEGGNGGGDLYVVFSPNQIKSATGNSGAYDPSNPNILHSLVNDAPDKLPGFIRGDVKAAEIAPNDAKWAKIEAFLAKFKPDRRAAMAKAVESGKLDDLTPNEKGVVERLTKEATPVAPPEPRGEWETSVTINGKTTTTKSSDLPVFSGLGRKPREQMDQWLADRGAKKRTVKWNQDVTLANGSVLKNRSMSEDVYDLADGRTVKIERRDYTSQSSAGGPSADVYAVVPATPRGATPKPVAAPVSPPPPPPRPPRKKAAAPDEEPDPIKLTSEIISGRLADRNMPKLAKVSRALQVGKANTTETRVQLQDKFLRWKKIQEDVEKATGAPIPEALNVYMTESLYYGRTGQRLEELDNNHIDPLIDEIKKRGLTLESVDEFLMARHAPERNAKIREINPDIESPSGMSDADAAEVLKKIDASGKRADYDAVEKRVRALIDETRASLVSDGLISQETNDEWKSQYKNYVPLRGWAENTEAEEELPRIGKGYDIRGKEAQQALGRKSVADSPIGYALTQAQQAVVRGEKNKVGQTALRFVEANPQPDLWTVDEGGDTTRLIDPKTGLVTTQTDHKWTTKDNVFAVKVDGKVRHIVFHGTYGKNLARALKNLGTANMNGFLRFMGSLVRVQARLATSWNPDFMIPNFIRDVGEAFINLQENDQKRFVKQFAKHLLPAVGGSFNALRGADGGKYAQAFREFDQAGGRIRFFGLEGVDDIKANITSKMRRLEGGVINNFRQAGERAVGAIEIANGSIENATRLAAYMAAIDVGMSKEKAASIAREMTVNFNRKGELGSLISAFYMFANAAVQGQTRMLGAMKHKRVRRFAYGLAATGALLAAYNLGAGGDDDDGVPYYLKLAPWIRDANLVIMWPKGMGHDGQYVTIPLPYGYSFFHTIGARMATVFHKKEPTGKAISAMAKSVLDAFDPLGRDDNMLAQVLPTQMKPAVHLYTNVNWTGRPINPEPNIFNKFEPDSSRAFGTASEFSKGAAEKINRWTGGTKHEPGWVDWSPGSIDYTLGLVTGGLGRFAKNTFDTGMRAYEGQEWQPEKTPIIRRFYGQKNEASDRAIYFEERDKVLNAYGRVRAFEKDKDGVNRSRFVKENRPELDAHGAFVGVDKERKDVREKVEALKRDDALSAAEKERRVKILEKRELTAMGRALKQLEQKRLEYEKSGAH